MEFYNDSYLGMHFVWWIIWIILVIWFFFSSYGKKKAEDKYIPFDNKTPLDILKERYARGEITKEEYLKAKETIDSNKWLKRKGN